MSNAVMSPDGGELAIEHRMVSGMHVFTSPDLPGLFVADQDEQTARSWIQPSVDQIYAIQKRLRERRLKRDGAPEEGKAPGPV